MTQLQPESISFSQLVDSIYSIHKALAARASRAVNVSLTTRNWLIGCYIQEFEQGGQDRAEYGKQLLERLSVQLKERGVSRAEVRELRRYRQFYQAYPQIRDSLTPEFPREHRAVEHLYQLVRPQRPRGSRQPALEPIGAIHYRDIVRSLSAQSNRPLIEGAASSRHRGGKKEAGTMKRQIDRPQSAGTWKDWRRCWDD